MADGRAETNGNRAMKRRARPALRLAGRVTATALGVLVVTLVAIQFARAIGENVSAARQLATIHSDISALERRRDEQQNELRRLRDPQGAIPEIHDRLRLVRPNEALIFVSPQPAVAPTADP
jgi:cell division protein FtsB